jgi:hypothetical protein
VAAFQALVLIPIAVLSPGLGLIFALSISGRWLLAEPNRQRVFFPILCAGILLLRLAQSRYPAVLGNLPLTLAFLGTGLSSLVAYKVFTRTWRISLSLVTVAYLNLAGDLLVPRIWSREFADYAAQLIKTFDIAFKDAAKVETVSGGVAVQRFHDMMIYAIRELQPGFWAFGTTLAAFVGFILLARGITARWRLDRIRLPFHPGYLTVAGLALVLPEPTRVMGLNLVLMLAGLFLVQGVSVLLYYWKNWFHDSVFLTAVVIVLIALNPFFILLIALLGAVDLWFNLRKLSHEEEIDESDPGERYA